MKPTEIVKIIQEISQEEGTDLQSALRDLLTDIRSAAAILELDYQRASTGSWDVFVEESFNFDTTVQLLVPAQELEDDDRYGWFAKIIQGDEWCIEKIYDIANLRGITRSMAEVKTAARLLYDEGFLQADGLVEYR